MREAVRPVAISFCLIAVAAVPARAQSTVADPPTTTQFMTRFDFAIVANAVSGDDPRFSWDTHWTGNFDFVDYVYGRLTFEADYQAIFGEELRPFDPHQSNYDLSVAASYRRGSNEYVLLFRHVSRHLVDRPKRDSVAMNAWIIRMLKRMERNGATIDLTGNLGPVVARAWLDYNWLGNVAVVVRRPITPVVGFYARGYGETYGVDEDVAGRGQQWGGRIEGGVRLGGRGGALDLFAGFERMIDADPLGRETRQWALAGVRVTGLQSDPGSGRP
jgi:hypothetical protein